MKDDFEQEAKEKKPDAGFSQEELAGHLGQDVIPSRFGDAWNGAIVRFQNRDLPTASYLTYMTRGAFMERMVKQGDDNEHLYRGHDSQLDMTDDLKFGQKYYTLSSGFYDGKHPLQLELGAAVKRPAPYHDPEMRSALTVFFDYTHRSNIPVTFDMSPLGLSKPQTLEQSIAALNIVGEALSGIKSGRNVDLSRLRQDLIERAGLSPAGKIDHELPDFPPPASKSRPSTPTI